MIRLQGVYGEGIQNYMNDAPVDIGIQNNFSDPVTPIIGVALPMWSVVAFWDHTWSDKWTSSLGGSYLEIDNSDGQSADAFHSGTYAAVNLIYYPVPNVLAGIEYTYGQRENFADDWSYNDNRVRRLVQVLLQADLRRQLMSRFMTRLGRGVLGLALATAAAPAPPAGGADAGADPGGGGRRLRQVQGQQ